MENNEIPFEERTYDSFELICIHGEDAGLFCSPINAVLSASIPNNRKFGGRGYNFINGTVTVVYGENMGESYPAVFKFYKRKNKLKFDDAHPRGLYDYMDFDNYDKYSVTYDGQEHELPPTRISYNMLKRRFYINVKQAFHWRITPLSIAEIARHVERFNNELESNQTTNDFEI